MQAMSKNLWEARKNVNEQLLTKAKHLADHWQLADDGSKLRDELVVVLGECWVATDAIYASQEYYDICVVAEWRRKMIVWQDMLGGDHLEEREVECKVSFVDAKWEQAVILICFRRRRLRTCANSSLAMSLSWRGTTRPLLAPTIAICPP